MRPSSPIANPPARAARRLLLLAFALLLAGALPALGAPPIKVTTAVPDTGEQGTLSLVVRIAGDNFGTDSQVAFYITGTTNPGGITVKNVRWVNAKALDATLDIDAAAQTEFKFDIQVRAGGRTGKGTELFKVLEKPSAGDTTPPADVMDLTLVSVTLQPEGDYMAELTWTAPYDDSGQAAVYEIAANPGDSFALDDWDLFLPGWGGGLPSHPEGAPGPPGSTDHGEVRALAANSQYTLVLRSKDSSENQSDLSNPVTLWTGPEPVTSWVADAGWIDGCPSGTGPFTSISNPQLAFSPDGSPFLFYRKECATTGHFMAHQTPAGWVHEPVDLSTCGGGSPTFGTDPGSGQPVALTAICPSRSREYLRLHRWNAGNWSTEIIDTIGGFGSLDLAFASDGAGTWRPVVAYRAGSKGGRSNSVVRLALQSSQGWEIHELASSARNGDVSLAIDDVGRPAVVYQNEPSQSGDDEALMFAVWDGSSWNSEQVDLRTLGEGECGSAASLAWNPSGWFTVVHICGTSTQPGDTSNLARVCDRDGSGGAWICVTFAELQGARATSLIFDDNGVARLAVATIGPAPTFGWWHLLGLWSREATDPPARWSYEIADWDVEAWYERRIGLAVDPTTGLPAIADYSIFRPVPAIRLVRRTP